MVPMCMVSAAHCRACISFRQFRGAMKFFSSVFGARSLSQFLHISSNVEGSEIKRIHCWVFKLGLEWDIYVAASLVYLYGRFL